ncbi:MAG: hypothetical protein ACRDND_33635, partial [Streptosporangiaceae bacterium]
MTTTGYTSAYVTGGRCRSGKRWFWIAAEYRSDIARECDDPVCVYGGPHEYGWEDTEELAITAMTEAAARLGGHVGDAYRGKPLGSAGMASAALKRINAARRRARPPRPGASAPAPVRYLYEPRGRYDDYGIREIPIVKVTAKRVYYDNSDSWDRSQDTITLGYVSREELEADTRCREDCPRDAPAAPVCGPHGRDFPHCVHFGGPRWPDGSPQCVARGGCGDDCQPASPGRKCARHGYTWD